MKISQMKQLQKMHELKELVDIDFKLSMTPPKAISDQLHVSGLGHLVFFNLEILAPDLGKYSDVAIAITKASCKVYLYLVHENRKETSATVEAFDSTESAFDAVLKILVQHCRPEDIREYVQFNIDL